MEDMERKLADGSKKTLVIDTKAASDPSRCRRIRLYGPDSGRRHIATGNFAAKSGYISTAELWREDLVFDPQTSGGLLAAVPADEAEEILLELSGICSFLCDDR